MSDPQQDEYDDFEKTEEELVAEAVEQIQDEMPAIDVQASWQEYDDSIEFRFELGRAKVEVTIPDDEPGNAQILVASLKGAFNQLLHAYLQACDESEEDEDA